MKLFKGLIFFTVLFALSRIVPHPPNFTPLLSGAIFLPYLFEDKRAVVLLPILMMLATDFILGFHGLMLWTYASFFIIGLLSLQFFKLTLNRVLMLSLASPILFFVITNFGVWAESDLYSKSVEGLMACYALGIPFYANSAVSTLLFSSCFFFIASLLREKSVFKNIRLL